MPEVNSLPQNPQAEEPQTDFSKFTPLIEERTSFLKRVLNLTSSLSKRQLFIIASIFLSLVSILTTTLLYPTPKKPKNLSYSTTTTSNLSPYTLSEKTPRRKEVLGFLPSWIVAKEEDVYTQHLTQLIYFGLGVTETGSIIQYNEEGKLTAEWSYLTSEHFTRLKNEARSTNTKVLVSIKSFDNETIDKLTSNPTATDRFIIQLIALIDQQKLDGVNIDFEYVTDTDFPTVKYFNRFLETLSKRLHEKDPSLLVSVDVIATAVLKDRAYDLVKIGEVVDQVILMGYDYHRATSDRAGPVAPISANENEHSIEESLTSLKGRVPSEKVILGVPFYGYEWQTLNSNHKAPTLPNTGSLATYQRVRELIENRDDVEHFWDETSASPWLVYKQSGAIKQIYYEDENSLEKKLEFAKEKKLGGIAIWALGYEGEYYEPWKIIENKLK